MVGVNCRAAELLGDRMPILRYPAEQDSSSDPRSTSPGGRECSGLKARYQQFRPFGRAESDKRVGNHRSGLGFSAARRLHLNIGAETKFGEKHQGFLQRGNTLPGEGRAEPGPCVVAPYRCERQRTGLSATIRGAFHSIVVKKNRMAVSGEPDIKLDPTTVEGLCLAKGSERVFRCMRGGTAVANHPRESDFGQAVIPRDPGSCGCRVAHRGCDTGEKFEAVTPGVG
jgi:hypothetical protein